MGLDLDAPLWRGFLGLDLDAVLALDLDAAFGLLLGRGFFGLDWNAALDVGFGPGIGPAFWDWKLLLFASMKSCFEHNLW
jgi:hypothetical protein